MITIAKINKKIQEKTKVINKEPQAAILIPIVTINNELHLLFQVRSDKLKWQPGDICFPGGHIEATDHTKADAAKRETYEELGIPVNEITILGKLPEFTATFGLTIYPIIAQITSLNKLNLNKDEVAAIFTVPIEWFIKNPPRQASMQVAYKPADDFPFDLLPNRSKEWQKRSEYTLYFYHYNKKYVIWGLTAQIVTMFIDLIN